MYNAKSTFLGWLELGQAWAVGSLGVPLWGFLGRMAEADVGHKPSVHWGGHSRPAKLPGPCFCSCYQGGGGMQKMALTSVSNLRESSSNPPPFGRWFMFSKWVSFTYNLVVI